MLRGLKSKKLITMIVATIVVVVNELTGKNIDQESVLVISGILATYLVSQGIADSGSQGAAKAAERALGQGAAMSVAVQGVFGGRGVKDAIYDDEEGPEWGDTSEMEDYDKPKELLG